jgi:hypothetical protein
LKNRDVALFKLGKGEEGSPKWVLIVPDRIVEELMEKENV